MKKILTAILLTCMIGPPIIAQEQTAEDLFIDADFFYNEDEAYEEAAYLYRQALKLEPDNANMKFLLGMCYINILGQEQEAIPQFLEATKNITLKYKEHRYSIKKAPHHTWFYLGEAYSKTNQMDLALDALNTFKSIKNFEKMYNVSITEERIKAVERSKIIRDAELNLRALYFNEPINSPDDDYSGVISANGKMMVWVNTKTFYEAVYMSTREGTEWTVPVLITPQIVSDGDLFPSGLSADGTMMLLVKKPKRGNKDIWYSEYDGMLWSPAQPLFGEINTNGEEDHASISPDGDRIYVSSDRRGGEGGLDIYYSDRQPDGQWGEPVNMGEGINTDQDETSAYVAPNGKRLIFASQGHFNMGGYDLFRCELQDDGSWSQPTNLGYPINTTGDNTYYIPLNNGLSGLLTRFTNDAIGMRDLWYVEILSEEGLVSDGLTLSIGPDLEGPKGLSYKDFAIIVVDDSTGNEIEVLYDADSDTFKALSGPDKSYRVISYKQN